MDGDSACNAFLAHLCGYLDGDMHPTLRLQCEAHVAACPSCRRLGESCRQTIRVYRQQPPPPLPAALHRKIMDKLSAQL